MQRGWVMSVTAVPFHTLITLGDGVPLKAARVLEAFYTTPTETGPGLDDRAPRPQASINGVGPVVRVKFRYKFLGELFMVEVERCRRITRVPC